MKLLKKAWKIDLSRIEDGYLYSEDVVYADTRGKAKSLFDLDNYTLRFGGDVNFLNAPVIRSFDDDIYLIDGVEMTKHQIEYENKIQSRNIEFDALNTKNPSGYAYIMKGGYYWRPNHNGYTEHKQYAGVYGIDEAVRICKSSDLSRYERPILIDPVVHNKMITDTIEDLKTRII